jgi:hypothetical protein
VTLLQQSEAQKLQAARLSAAQQLEAVLKLQQQSAQQQLQQETQQLHDSWSERCRQAEAAAAKQQALKAHAESEVSCCRGVVGDWWGLDCSTDSLPCCMQL